MLTLELGRQIKARRTAMKMGQEALCRQARVSRAVLSRLENESSAPVQTDIVERLCEGLGVTPHVTLEAGRPLPRGRVEERLREQLRREKVRERHLRLALDLCAHPRSARAKIRRALEQVALWEACRSCSPGYIERWRNALSGTPRAVALAMTSFGDWENAMFQNTPWSFLWT